MGTSIKPLMKANQAADDSVGGDHSRRPPQSDRVPSPRLILSHRALSLGGYRTYSPCTHVQGAYGAPTGAGGGAANGRPSMRCVPPIRQPLRDTRANFTGTLTATH